MRTCRVRGKRRSKCEVCFYAFDRRRQASQILPRHTSISIPIVRGCRPRLGPWACGWKWLAVLAVIALPAFNKQKHTTTAKGVRQTLRTLCLAPHKA